MRAGLKMQQLLVRSRQLPPPAVRLPGEETSRHSSDLSSAFDLQRKAREDAAVALKASYCPVRRRAVKQAQARSRSQAAAADAAAKAVSTEVRRIGDSTDTAHYRERVYHMYEPELVVTTAQRSARRARKKRLRVEQVRHPLARSTLWVALAAVASLSAREPV